MSTAHRLLIVVAGVGLALGTASQAQAFMQSGATQAGSEPSAVYTVPTHTTQLSPIVVNGQRINFALALQMIKTALHRPWSGSRADRNKLVCGFVDKLGTHFQRLSCMTNAAHFKRQDAAQIGVTLARGPIRIHSGILPGLANGEIPVSVANWTNTHWINRGALLKVLKKLPPAGSSYTLRITDHGKPVVDYVIKDGDLTAVHHYTYKDKKKKN